MSLRIDFYSAAGAKLDVPPLSGNGIAAFSHSAAEKKVASFSLSVPLGEAAEVQSGRRVYVYDSTEGLIFKGQIDVIETMVQGAERMVVATGWSLARIKMVKKTTLNRRFDNASLSTILSALLSGTGYSAGSVDTPSTNLTIPLFGNTIWDALGKVADGFGYLLREDFINDTIDMGAFGDASGVVLGNVESHSPALSANPYFGVISGLKQKARTQEVYNKLIPLGQQQGIASTANAPYLTLENSTRSSPYTIQTGTNPDGTTYWYISDSTSVTTYGECERYIPFSFVAPLGTATADLQRSANTLYDLAVTALQKEKDEQVAYEVDVTNLRHRTGGAYTFELGQTMRLKYHGTIVTETGSEVLLDIDRDLYVMEYTRAFDSAGASTWRLVVSTISRIVPGANDVLTDFVSKLTGQQIVPIPFIIFGDGKLRIDEFAVQVDGSLAARTGFWFVNGFQADPTTSGLVGYMRGTAVPDFGGEPYADAQIGAQSTTGTQESTITVTASADGVGVPSFHIQGITDLDGGVTGDLYYFYDTSDNKFKLTLDGVSVGGAMKSANTGAYLIPTLGAGGAVRSGNGSYGSYAAIGLADIAAPAAPTATTFASSVNHNVTMPATVNAGDLLVVILATVGATNPATPTGWASVGTQANGSNSHISVFSKSADGTEDGTTVNFTVAGGSVGAAHVYRIPAGTWDTGAAIAISTGATAAGNPDPSSVTPTQVGRFLAIACAAEQSGIGSFNTTHGGYSGFTESHNGTGASDVAVVSSYLTGLNTNTENPGAYSGGSITNSAAFVIAIQASPAISEAAYVTGLDVVVSGTPGYLQIQLATGAAGAESVIGTFKINTADPTLEFPAILPVSSAARLSARIATDAAAANHNVTLHVINQDDVA